MVRPPGSAWSSGTVNTWSATIRPGIVTFAVTFTLRTLRGRPGPPRVRILGVPHIARPPGRILVSITDWTRQALPAMLDDLKALVELETHSYDKAALVQGLRGVRTLAAERLGTPDDEVLHDGGQYGDVLELTYHGTAPGTVLMMCHYDTVWPIGTLAGWPFTVADGKVSGPGAFDM